VHPGNGLMLLSLCTVLLMANCVLQQGCICLLVFLKEGKWDSIWVCISAKQVSRSEDKDNLGCRSRLPE
jgi:hypothetical protein